MVKFVWNNNIAMCIGALIVLGVIVWAVMWYRKKPQATVQIFSSGPVNPFQNQAPPNIPPFQENFNIGPSNIPPPSPPPPPPSRMESQYGNTSLAQ